jgi:glycerophosphoryl diester phosphodiesterase
MPMPFVRSAFVSLTAFLLLSSTSSTSAHPDEKDGPRCDGKKSPQRFRMRPHKPSTRPNPPRNIQVGPRPYFLVGAMDDGHLKRQLDACKEGPFHASDFSIGHRGAALEFPEETRESLEAAARMGAGVLECDVTFTKDRQLVCRHSQCDLHTTTNILAIPELAAKCTKPFSPADPATGEQASAMCCTSDITLDEFKSLCGKMDGFNPNATTVDAYLAGTPNYRTDMYATCGTVLTHKEYITLASDLGTKFTPELKVPSVTMPFQGTYTQEQFAQQMIDEYKAAGISPRKVYAQSFNLPDILYWLAKEPAFGKQAVYLDEEVDLPGGFDAAVDRLPDVAKQGVRIVAPPTWALVTVDGNNRIIPSRYAAVAKASGLDIITWTLERSGPLATVGRTNYYYQSITPAIHNDGDVFELLDVLARRIGVLGVFSDWAGTVTYYANCMGK